MHVQLCAILEGTFDIFQIVFNLALVEGVKVSRIKDGDLLEAINFSSYGEG